MRRYLGRLAFALMILILFSTKFVDITVGAGFGRHPLETAWSATGLPADRLALDYWSEGPAKAAEDPERLARRLGARLGAGDATVFAGEADGVRFANLDGDLPAGGELVLTVQSQPERAYLGISCYYDHLPADLLGLERRIRLALLGCALKGEFSWTIDGRYPGRLRGAGWRAMWVRTLRAIDAGRRGDRPGDEIIEAFSPLLPAASGAAPGAANLAVTVRYDKTRLVSLVTLSSPNLPAVP